MRASRYSLLLAITVLAFLATTAAAETWHAAGAFEVIQVTIDGAAFGDIVIIDEGTYTGHGLIMKNGVSLQGEGNNPALVIIDGEGSGPIIKCNAYTNATISGLTLRNGAAPRGSGGGIMCGSNSSPEIINCVFEHNTADRFGGGFYSLLSEPSLVDCHFEGNTAGSDGGGACFSNSSPYLNGCLFATNGATKGGGVMATGGSYPTLVDCTFSGNVSSSFGGGLASINSTPTLLECTFEENISQASSSGGIYGSRSEIAIELCTISNNGAWTTAGGLLLVDSSNMVASESTVLDNIAGAAQDIEVRLGSHLHLICCEYNVDYFAGEGSITFDNEDCLSAVETSTWGAVRTLYR